MTDFPKLSRSECVDRLLAVEKPLVDGEGIQGDYMVRLTL
jgi:hypothetical protein